MNDAAKPSDPPLVQTFLGVLSKSDRYPPQHIKGFQDTVLKDLVAFAAAQVPFYRGRLTALSDGEGNAVLERWTDVPILTSEEVKSHQADLRPDALPAGQGRALRYLSSGSTGRATAYYRSALSEEGQQAGFLRHYRAFQLDPARDLAFIRLFDPSLARFRSVDEHEHARSWTPQWFNGGTGGRIRRLSVFTAIAKQIEWLRGLGPVYLNTFPSNVLALAQHVAQFPEQRPELLAILTAGEPLTANTRKLCREILGCDCIDILSNAEAGSIAMQCPAGRCYHAQSELCRVEVLRTDGGAARPGQWGRLVVTPLYNFAMPLIRYATGDYVRVAAPCGCGRHHLALELEVGRPNNMFKTARGQWFRPDIDVSRLWPILGGSRWQLVQMGLREFELRYARKPELGASQTKELRRLIAPHLPKGSKIRITRRAAIGLPSSGKLASFAGLTAAS